MNILINSLGIQDSGGITVLDKLLFEIKNSGYDFLIICNKNKNIEELIDKYKINLNFHFKLIENKGFLNRLYFENIVFKKIIKERNIKLVYNFSGSAQFFSKVPQLIKVQNLLFYSKKIDKVYFQKKHFILWFKQIYLKRVIFHSMVKQASYLEVQSNHVKEYISDFIQIDKKVFFVKSDIDVKDELFQKSKNYDFSKKIRFLYIVGPHFGYLHKNFEDFVKVLLMLEKENVNFEIIITLTEEQLHNYKFWDKSLDKYTRFLGYVSKNELVKQFKDNTILISTSIIETLGLHVIEAVQNGILSITPNEKYCKDVYGGNIMTYDLFNIEDLMKVIKSIIFQSNNEIKEIIILNQQYLIENEKEKFQNILNIFDKILKDKNVQK